MKIQRVGPEWWLFATNHGHQHATTPWATGTGALAIYSGKWCYLEAGIIVGGAT